MELKADREHLERRLNRPVASLGALTELPLSGAKVATVGPGGWASLGALERVDLSQTALAGREALAPLLGAPRLAELDWPPLKLQNG